MKTYKQGRDTAELVKTLVQKHQACEWEDLEALCRQFLEHHASTHRSSRKGFQQQGSQKQKIQKKGAKKKSSQQQGTHNQSNKSDDFRRFVICKLGEALTQQQKFNEATWLYQSSLETEPNYYGFHLGLGNTYKAQGQWKASIQHHQAALELKPDSPELYASLGEVLDQNGQPEAAIAAYQQALTLNPHWAKLHYALGNALADAGHHEAAIKSYKEALALQPDLALARFGLCMKQLPIIYNSAEEIQNRRTQYQDSLQVLAQYYEAAGIQERATSVDVIGSLQPFYLAYQGLNDKWLQQQYGEMIHRIMSSRYPQWTQPVNFPALRPGEKIRVGFVSRYFYRHSNWKIPIRGWVENLNKSEFELFGYHTGSVKDSDTVAAAQAFDKFEQGNFSLEDWAKRIRQDQLHVLIFPEFGMDPMTVRLGCLRLAPVQASSWGHPTTSGLPTIDYYLSSDLMESAEAQSHYSEKLVRLPNLSIHYTPLKIKPVPMTKANIGLKSDAVMYWCCQSLYKYLPQHDDVFPQIAQTVPAARFVFLENSSQHVTQVFRQRLAQAFAAVGLNYEDFCVFIARLSFEEFAGVSAIADVFLDSIGWSGCNSTLESVAHNLPVVTMPGELMRGRHSFAILKMLGIEQTVAQTKEDYVQLAVSLGKEPEFRNQISQQIAANKHRLYGDLEPVRALEKFLRQVTEPARQVSGASTDQPSAKALNAETQDRVSEALREANQLCRSNQLSEAEEVYQQLLDDYPSQPDALLGLALLLQSKEQFSKAELLLQRVTQAQPQLVKAWFALGNLQLMREQFAAATAAYKQALALRPDAVSIYNNLGFALQSQGLWEEAIAAYQQALAIQPSCTEAEANLGNALHASGTLKQAQLEYYANLNYKLGEVQQSKGKLSVAATYFRHAVALQPSFPEAEQALSVCQEAIGPSAEKAC